MRIKDCTIDDIKSISQKALAFYWSRCAGQNKMPLRSEFEMPKRGHDPNYLAIWRANRSRGKIEFQSVYQGAHIAKAFQNGWKGQSMADVIPSPLRQAALEGAEFCVRQGQGVYMVYRTVDPNGQSVDCERMLLPLGDGKQATHMVASMELFSPEGDAVISQALGYFTKKFEIIFAGTFS